jgi:hypothetical protein
MYGTFSTMSLNGDLKSFDNKINKIFYATFFTCSLIFVVVYLPIQLQICGETLVQTNEYVENATCFCKTNVGASTQLGQAIFKNTSFYEQFPKYPYYYDIVTVKSISIAKDGYMATMHVPFISHYMKYYYGIEWTNQLIHDFNISIFGYDTDGYASIYNTNGSDFACSGAVYTYPVPVNVTDPYFDILNQTYSVDECLAFNRKYFGDDFMTYINVNYLDNKEYQDNCDLDYCYIKQCTSSSVVSLCLFCCSIISSIYTALRVVKHILKFFHKKETNKVSAIV